MIWAKEETMSRAKIESLQLERLKCRPSAPVNIPYPKQICATSFEVAPPIAAILEFGEKICLSPPIMEWASWWDQACPENASILAACISMKIYPNLKYVRMILPCNNNLVMRPDLINAKKHLFYLAIPCSGLKAKHRESKTWERKCNQWIKKSCWATRQLPEGSLLLPGCQKALRQAPSLPLPRTGCPARSEVKDLRKEV